MVDVETIYVSPEVHEKVLTDTGEAFALGTAIGPYFATAMHHAGRALMLRHAPYDQAVRISPPRVEIGD